MNVPFHGLPDFQRLFHEIYMRILSDARAIYNGPAEEDTS